MEKCVSIDPVAGGEALLVLVGNTYTVLALTCFRRPGDGRLRLASGSNDSSVRDLGLGRGGAALFVLEGHTGWVYTLTAFADPATGEIKARRIGRQDFAGVGREHGRRLHCKGSV